MKQLVVWWSSRIPIIESEKYPVETIAEAKRKIKELTDRDLANKSITDNVGGLTINDEGEEWYCDECCEDIFICKCD